MSAAPSLAYTVHPGTGPYLGLVHGFLSSSAQWMHNLAALSSVCQPVTINLWGHGKSPAPKDEALYHPNAYIEQLEHIRLTLGVDQWFVGGYSIGAGITIRYTHQHPARVLAHLFTNSSSGFASQTQVEKWRLDAEAGAERIIDGGEPAIERIPVHPRFAKNLPEDIYARLATDAKHLSPMGIANALRHTTPNASIRDIAADNPRPALLCFGRKEKRFAEAKQWATDNMSQLSVVELDASHAVNMEDSSGFNASVCQFITQHASNQPDLAHLA